MINKLFLYFFLKFLITFLTLFHSFLDLIVFDPGLVDSPPISIISAPDFNHFLICLNDFFLLLNFPPSEKLSGVKFKIPIIDGLKNYIF